MPFILGTLSDRRGNIIPHTNVFCREADNPTGDRSSGTTDAFGNYELTVALSGTMYDLWVDAEGTVESSNYIGRRVASGDVVSSFTLGTDPTWLTNHEADGTHGASSHDSVNLKASGYVQTADASFEMRIGGTNEKLRISDIGDTFFFNPFPIAGANDQHIGLSEGYNASIRNFYFGVLKTKWINTDGGFQLGAGTFSGASVFASTAAFQNVATFPFTSYPRMTGFVYVAPTSDFYLTPKKYVDGSIAAAVGALSFDRIYSDINVNEVRVVGTVGAGQIILRHNGIDFANFTGGSFALGSVFTPLDLLHLRKSGVPTRVRVERTGTGQSTTLLEENAVGTASGSNEFYLRSNGTNAAVIDGSQNIGIGIFSGLVEKLSVAGNVMIQNNIRFTTKAVPANPAAEEAVMYLKTRNPANNEIAVKIKHSGSMQEVIVTSPEGICSVCGMEGPTRDPYFDTIKGKMIVSFYCGHSFEVDMPLKPRN